MALDDLTDDQLLTAITMLEKKIKKLAKMGPGAGMATAANNSHLRKHQAAAVARGLDLTPAEKPATGVSKSARKYAA